LAIILEILMTRDDKDEQIEYAVERICDGLPRLHIQKQIIKEFDCSETCARNTFSKALDKLGEKGEKFNEVDSKIGFIEQRYHEMLKTADEIESPTQKMNMQLSILRDLGNLIGANHHVKERIILNIQNNPPPESQPARVAVTNALARIEEKNHPQETVIEVSQDAANLVTKTD